MKILNYLKAKILSDLSNLCFILFPAIIIYDFIVSKYIGYAKEGIKETMILYFMGSYKVDTLLYLWLFLQTLIILICISIIKQDMNNQVCTLIMKFKSVDTVFAVLTIRIVVILGIYYFLIYLFTYIYIVFFSGNLFVTEIYSKTIHLQEANIFVLISNSTLNTFIFILLISLIGIMIGSLSNAYLFLQIYQICAVFIAGYHRTLAQYLPLLHSMTIFFDDANSCILILLSQLIIAIILIWVLNILVKKKIEKII